MGRSRSSILGLMAIVGFFALALTSLRSASGWVRGTTNLAVILLFAGSLRARFARSGSARAWWFGFALSGWAYFVVADGRSREYLWSSEISNPLHRAVFEAYRPIPASVPYSNANFDINLQYSIDAGKVYHNLATIALAYLGASAIALTLGRPARPADEGRFGPGSVPGGDR